MRIRSINSFSNVVMVFPYELIGRIFPPGI